MKTEAGAAAAGPCQYPALVALSAQLELTALHDVLLEGLASVIPGVALGLCLLDPRLDTWRQVVALSEGHGDAPSSRLVPLLEQVRHLSPGCQVCVEDGHTAFPVFSGQRVLGAVLISGRFEGTPDPALASLLMVYGNQLGLLYRSRTDALTGLFNRQSFDDTMARLFSEATWARRRQHDLRGRWCVALLDLDHFKRINDTYGHLYGDEVLLLMAQMMMRTFRDEDLLFRYGGEEFVVLLADVDETLATQVLERFRKVLEVYDFPQVGQVTASIGFSIPGRLMPVSEVLVEADKALYYAKEHGRNQVCGYQQLLAEGLIRPAPLAESDVELF